jgi:hypothetical protein
MLDDDDTPWHSFRFELEPQLLFQRREQWWEARSDSLARTGLHSHQGNELFLVECHPYLEAPGESGSVDHWPS